MIARVPVPEGAGGLARRIPAGSTRSPFLVTALVARSHPARPADAVMGGMELCRRVEAGPRTPAAPVISVSKVVELGSPAASSAWLREHVRRTNGREVR